MACAAPRLIALPFGENTEESMKAVAAIVRSEGLDSVTLVTDPAHSARAPTPLAHAVRTGCPRLGHHRGPRDHRHERVPCYANPPD